MHLHPGCRLDALAGIAIQLKEGGTSRRLLQTFLQGQFMTITSFQCDLGSICLILAAWIRYAGTASSLSGNGAYALLITGQVGPVTPHAPWTEIAHLYYPKVLRKHFPSDFRNSSGKVQRAVVRLTREDNCDHVHGRHEPDR